MGTYCSEFRIITWEGVFYKNTEQNGPFSVKLEPIVPSSESRAEQIGP